MTEAHSSSELLEILKAKKILKDSDISSIIEKEKVTGKTIQAIIIEEGLASEKDIFFALGESLGIPVLNLNLIRLFPELVKLVPKRIAEKYQVIPVSKIGNILSVASSDPLNVFAMDDLKGITGCTIRAVLATSKDIQTAIENSYADSAQVDELLDADSVDVDSIEVVRENDADQDGPTGTQQIGEEAPVIRMVNLILHEAIKRRASDIHFEPYEHKLRIRYRIDGVLKDAFSPPKNMYSSLLTRLKIISDLDITEKRLPQDGRFKARLDTKDIDFRVSVLPTHFGEKAVLRVLDKTSLQIGLAQLGFLPDTIRMFEEMNKRPYGMILVTGPTGSGKSTTLYSVLTQLNTKDRNIMTIEDPVEYQVEGITQTQVNPDIGLTFANGLRSLLRQSPDIILVGEIRDSETADIAVKAALTGHLLFSTLHTNNACSSVTRLIDMGIEPFLVASSLIGATAQRLLRKICVNCKEPCQIPDEVFERFHIDRKLVEGAKAFHGKGCQACNQTGYKGRIATMELFSLTEEIQQMVIERRATDDIEKIARRNGMKSLFENALRVFAHGDTTLEEVLRITSSD